MIDIKYVMKVTANTNSGLTDIGTAIEIAKYHHEKINLGRRTWDRPKRMSYPAQAL